MYPGIPRATSGALIGLFVGFAVVTLLRVVIGIEPSWNLGLALTMGIFTSAAGFIWGMGGFNPKMSEHADDSQPSKTADEIVEEQGVLSVLGGTSWMMAFVSLIIMAVLIALAYVPGLGLAITDTANGSPREIGTVPMTLFGSEIMVNQVILLVIWIGVTVLSLALAGGVIAWLTTGLSNQVQQVQNVEKTGTGLPRGLERSLANQAGRLAERIAPPEDRETTAVVTQDKQ